MAGPAVPWIAVGLQKVALGGVGLEWICPQVEPGSHRVVAARRGKEVSQAMAWDKVIGPAPQA